jgi:uncharacterized protein (TIGR02996 family)
MGSGEALFEDILAAPDDNARRFAYADYLAGSGEEARAELIRYQCLAAGMPSESPVASALRRMSNEILLQYQEDWDEPLVALGAKNLEYRRGFVEALTINVEDFLKHQDQIFALAPLRELRLRKLSPEHVDALALSPHLAKLLTLDLRANKMDGNCLRGLLQSCHLGQLKALLLDTNRLGDHGASCLAGCQSLASLLELGLNGNGIGVEGARVLAESSTMPRLQILSLAENVFGDAGAGAIARARCWNELRVLDLEWNNLSERGAWEIARSSGLPGLRELRIEVNPIGESAAREIERAIRQRGPRSGPGYSP